MYGHPTAEECETNQHKRMNEIAHNLANEYLSYCIQHPHEKAISSIPSPHWKLRIKGLDIVKNMEECINCQVYEKDMIKHILRRNEIEKNDLPLFNLYAYGQARKGFTHKERLFAVKFDSQFLPVAGRLHLLDKNKPPNCPCCGHRSEDISHMMNCPNPHVTAKRKLAFDKVQTWLEHMKTDPEIIRIMIGTLRNGPQCKFRTQFLEDTNNDIREAAIIQDRQNRLQFHKGRLATR